MFPCVLFVNTQKAEIANIQQEIKENRVDMCVTSAKRSIVGVLILP